MMMRLLLGWKADIRTRGVGERLRARDGGAEERGSRGRRAREEEREEGEEESAGIMSLLKCAAKRMRHTSPVKNGHGQGGIRWI